MRIVAVTDVYGAGFEFMLSIGIEVSGRPPAEVATQLAAFPEVLTVVLMSGEYDIEIVLVARDQEALGRFVQDQLAGIAGIRRLTPSLRLEVYKFQTGPRTDRRERPCCARHAGRRTARCARHRRDPGALARSARHQSGHRQAPAQLRVDGPDPHRRSACARRAADHGHRQPVARAGTPAGLRRTRARRARAASGGQRTRPDDRGALRRLGAGALRRACDRARQQPGGAVTHCARTHRRAEQASALCAPHMRSASRSTTIAGR